jgi:hypothetical protein
MSRVTGGSAQLTHFCSRYTKTTPQDQHISKHRKAFKPPWGRVDPSNTDSPTPRFLQTRGRVNPSNTDSPTPQFLQTRENLSVLQPTPFRVSFPVLPSTASLSYLKQISSEKETNSALPKPTSSLISVQDTPSYFLVKLCMPCKLTSIEGPIVLQIYKDFQYTDLAPDGRFDSTDACSHQTSVYWKCIPHYD